MKKLFLVLAAPAVLFLSSCGGGSKTDEKAEGTSETSAPAASETHFKEADLVDLDMSSAGINVVAKAPKDSKIIKYEVDGSQNVYGGKFFKMSYKFMDGTVADNMALIKGMATDKELNPGFDKLEDETENGFLKKTTDGKLSFVHMLDLDGKTLIISDGMPYDVSPDQSTDYTADDIRTEYAAAKACKAKQAS
ncbi:MAG: hypothetical protein U0V74_05090 [Chitinophagales bacterium]